MMPYRLSTEDDAKGSPLMIWADCACEDVCKCYVCNEGKITLDIRHRVGVTEWQLVPYTCSVGSAASEHVPS